MAAALRPNPPLDIEVLTWSGCPSTPALLDDLRVALAEIGLDVTAVRMTAVEDDAEAQRRHFVGSPTVLVEGRDAVPPPPYEAAALTCRVYRRRDGSISPTPDPLDLRAALNGALRERG